MESIMKLVEVITRIGAVIFTLGMAWQGVQLTLNSSVSGDPRSIAQIIMCAIGMVFGLLMLLLAPDIVAKLAMRFLTHFA